MFPFIAARCKYFNEFFLLAGLRSQSKTSRNCQRKEINTNLGVFVLYCGDMFSGSERHFSITFTGDDMQPLCKDCPLWFILPYHRALHHFTSEVCFIDRGSLLESFGTIWNLNWESQDELAMVGPSG